MQGVVGVYKTIGIIAYGICCAVVIRFVQALACGIEGVAYGFGGVRKSCVLVQI